MGYNRSRISITRVLNYFKPVIANPDTSHEWETESWDVARRLVGQLRQALHAAQFYEEFIHIHELRETHVLRHRGKKVILEPRYPEESLIRKSALPPGAQYVDTRKTTVSFPEVSDVLAVILALRTVPMESTWKEITFPKIDWEGLEPKHRIAIHEMAVERDYDIMYVDRLSLVRLTEGSMLADMVYDPEEESNAS